MDAVVGRYAKHCLWLRVALTRCALGTSSLISPAMSSALMSGMAPWGVAGSFSATA
jgi:hypothetical protein